MLNVLSEAEECLSQLLKSEDGWTSLDVDYDPPRVERLWRPFGDGYRLYLHRIHPCTQALYHPHPWPSAIKIVSGGYEMGVGFGSGFGPDEPPLAVTLHLSVGSTYEMTHPDGWHYVLPSVSNLSVMVTGARWGRWAPEPTKKLLPLKDQEVQSLLAEFRTHYPR